MKERKPLPLHPVLVAVGRHLVFGYRGIGDRLHVVETTHYVWKKNGTTLGISWNVEWVYVSETPSGMMA